jgi:hypothetical protein
MAIRYDPWTSSSPTLNPLPGSAPAVDPSSLPLTEEPVAGFKPATKQGIRYESFNAGRNYRAVPVAIPTEAPAKGEDTLYGRYTAAVPKLFAQASHLAAIGDIEQAKTLVSTLDTWVDADQGRLLKHMSYQGKDPVAKGFAENAAKAANRPWHTDPAFLNLLDPKTNSVITTRKMQMMGVPSGSLLAEQIIKAGAGDQDALNEMSAWNVASKDPVVAPRSTKATAGGAPGAPGVVAQPQPITSDPAAMADAYRFSKAELPQLVGDAYTLMTPQERAEVSIGYTGLIRDQGSMAPVVGRIMAGAANDTPAVRKQLFRDTVQKLQEFNMAAGDSATAERATLALTAIIGARPGAAGRLFPTAARDMSATALSVAQRAAAMETLGFPIDDRALQRQARLAAGPIGGASGITDADKQWNMTFQNFTAPFSSLTGDMPLTTDPGTASKLGTETLQGGVAPKVGAMAPPPESPGFVRISDAIKDMAAAVGYSSAGEENITPEDLRARMLLRSGDLGDTLMQYAGAMTMPDGSKKALTKAAADDYATLLLSYISEHPGVSVATAYNDIRKDLAPEPVAPVTKSGTDTSSTAAPTTIAATPEGRATQAQQNLKTLQEEAQKLGKFSAGREAVVNPTTKKETVGAVPGTTTVDASVFKALNEGVSTAADWGISPGREPIKLAQTKVVAALRPVTGGIQRAVQNALLARTPAQLESPTDIDEVLAQAMVQVKEELKAGGAQRTAQAIGDDVLRAAASDEYHRARAYARGFIRGLPAGGRGADLAVGELMPEAQRGQLRERGDSVMVSNILAAGVLYSAVSGPSDVTGRQGLVKRLDAISYDRDLRRNTLGDPLKLLTTERAIQKAVEQGLTAGDHLDTAGIRFTEYANTRFMDAITPAPAPAAATAPAVSAPAPIQGPEAPQAYVLHAQAARGNTLDATRALAAGRAVTDQITSKVFTEDARAKLNDPVALAIYTKTLGPGVVQSVRNKITYDFYKGSERDASGLPSKFYTALGTLVDQKQKALDQAKVDRAIEVHKANRLFDVQNPTTGGEGLGLAAPAAPGAPPASGGRMIITDQDMAAVE